MAQRSAQRGEVDYLFYGRPRACEVEGSRRDEEFRAEFWRPSKGELVPRGMARYPYAIWWMLHRARVFANDEYSIVVIRQGDRLVHRSLIFPGYFRFPFMARQDLQIASTWTHPDYRGKGLALAAAREAIARTGAAGGTLWYLVGTANQLSIRVAEKAGFTLYGVGARTCPWGLRLLGTYTLRERLPQAGKMGTNLPLSASTGGCAKG